MIAASVPDFDDFMNDIVDLSVEETKKLVYQLWDLVITRSPVLRGHYRASWKITVGGELDESFTREGGTEDSPLPPPSRPDIVINDSFPVVFISNAIPYAEMIENGYSGKAPNGVLEISIQSLGL